MSIFHASLSACQQLDLLGSAVEHSPALLPPVRAFLRQQVQDMKEVGHRAQLEELPSARQVLLRWKLPGRQAHPRDQYVLRFSLENAAVVCEFIGPSRSAVALRLSTRCLSEDTLSRWAGTFYEWALTSREAR